MASPLDDELGIPAAASIQPQSVQAVLKASNNSVSIPVSRQSLRESTDTTRRSLLVGRQAATADLRIQHGSISRKHAVLYYLDSNLIVKDLGGKHGTSVNDQRVQETVELRDGDRILFGNVRESIFRVEIKELPDVSNEMPAEIKEETPKTAHQHDADQSMIEQAGKGLTGREKRQAEISAMMASLEQAPTYETFKAAEPEQETFTQSQPAIRGDESVVAKFRLPVTQTFRVSSESGGRNAVTALAVDPAGSRFVVGSTDNSLRYYDFSGMNQGRHDSFRSVIPDDGHWPVACAFSNTGDRIIVGTGSVQPVVMDREGQEIIQFVRGDMYVTDKSKTAGHTAAVTAADWHPLERDWVLTGSIDGSARLWDLANGRTQFKKLTCDRVFSPKNARGQRTSVTAACFHPGGREFALGTSCGSIQIWSRTRVSGRPERVVVAAHGENKAITALTFNMDGSRLASRSVDDDQVKVWNSQRLSRSSTAIVTCREAVTVHDHANMAFSPDGKVMCVTVAESRKKGRLHFYDVGEKQNTVDSVLSLDTEDSSPIVIKWHAKVNQLFVGCADGHTLVLYDQKWSKRGALLAASKAGRAVDDLSALLNSRAPTGSAGVSGEIVTPFSLPMYRKDITSDKKRKREERKDPVKSREPERPATGKHKVGGQSGGATSFSVFVADQRVNKTKPIAGKDPREALFQYKEGKSFVNRAYEGNESKLADRTAEEEFKDGNEEK